MVVLCDEFEESLGMLLGVVLRWKEAMQLSEPRVLIQHIALVRAGGHARLCRSPAHLPPLC